MSTTKDLNTIVTVEEPIEYNVDFGAYVTIQPPTTYSNLYAVVSVGGVLPKVVRVNSVKMAGSATWRFNPSADVHDITPHLSQEIKSLAGVKYGVGIIEVFEQEDDTAQNLVLDAYENGGYIELRLYIDESIHWLFMATILNIEYSVPIRRVVRTRYTFRSIGKIEKVG